MDSSKIFHPSVAHVSTMKTAWRKGCCLPKGSDPSHTTLFVPYTWVGKVEEPLAGPAVRGKDHHWCLGLDGDRSLVGWASGRLFGCLIWTHSMSQMLKHANSIISYCELKGAFWCLGICFKLLIVTTSKALVSNSVLVTTSKALVTSNFTQTQLIKNRTWAH